MTKAHRCMRKLLHRKRLCKSAQQRSLAEQILLSLDGKSCSVLGTILASFKPISGAAEFQAASKALAYRLGSPV